MLYPDHLAIAGAIMRPLAVDPPADLLYVNRSGFVPQFGLRSPRQLSFRGTDSGRCLCSGPLSGRKPEYIVGNQMIEADEKTQNLLQFLRECAQ